MTTNDPILLEVMRSRLQAVVDEGAVAIERTAVSPIVAEGKDFSTNVLTATGDLLVGGGKVEYKWPGARNLVRATLARHGASIAPGDVFAANDPHNGGGNHPQDIEVCHPVHVNGVLVAWVAASAHVIDVGGMTFGSWAPDATECFQEALRFPPVRLFRAGDEQHDIWALILNNVRLPQLVEMDVRGLVAGCNVAARKLTTIVEHLGVDEFVATADALCDATEHVLRDRIRRLAPGSYALDGWVEWGDERYHLPCTLTVAGGELCFDYTGAPPQVPHFINSKQYIVEGQVVADVRASIGQDLPFCEGLWRPIRVICPAGTIVDSVPPAPIGSAHLDVAMNCTALAVQCLQFALAATADDDLPRLYAGPSGQGALATHSWGYTTAAGTLDGMVVSESFQPGSSAAAAHDGSDLFANVVGSQHILDFVDIEILEAWYPLHVLEKRVADGAYGAGTQRSGAGCCMSYRVTEGRRLHGAMFGMRETLPIGGSAGGEPGAPTEFVIRRAGTEPEVLEAHATGVELAPGEVFEFRAGSGGGWGDPLDRLPERVRRDVTIERLRREDAASVYGVVLDEDVDGQMRVDLAATSARRAAARAARLRAANEPAVAHGPDVAAAARASASPSESQPLYHGVVQRGRYAIAEASGAVLAVAPMHWTAGCPVLEADRTSARGIAWRQRSYLDPMSGRALYVEAVPVDAPRSFTTAPTRWADA
jgi:N-methylhydantoinase B